MVDPKKSAAKPIVPPTAANSAAAHERRPALPSLSPLPGEKPASAVQPAATPQPVPLTAHAAAPDKSVQPASAPSQANASAVTPAKPAEVIGPKLRKREEILKALRAGAKVVKVDGLFRIVASDGTKNATSKRRILSLESQKLLVASADGKTFTLDVAADKLAGEPKAAADPKPAGGTK